MKRKKRRKRKSRRAGESERDKKMERKKKNKVDEMEKMERKATRQRGRHHEEVRELMLMAEFFLQCMCIGKRRRRRTRFVGGW